MKLRSKWHMSLPAQTNRFVCWSRRLFLFIGVLALGYVGFAFADAKIYQSYQTWRFQRALDDTKSSIGRDEHLSPASIGAPRLKIETLPTGGPEGSAVGRIEISAIDLDVMILEGIEDETLRRGVGHIPSTALPGEVGNVAIAGHRDTFFRPLRNIRKDDEITLTTLHGSYRYRVDSTKVVEPEDVTVLDHTNDAILTLVTCYPFQFIGAAPQRFIVRAHRSLE